MATLLSTSKQRLVTDHSIVEQENSRVKYLAFMNEVFMLLDKFQNTMLNCKLFLNKWFQKQTVVELKGRERPLLRKASVKNSVD